MLLPLMSVPTTLIRRDESLTLARYSHDAVREMHNLHEKEPIGFSHFVRWVVAQDVASMHRAWRPYVPTCRFHEVAYDFIGRFETVQRDLPELMARMGLTSEREKRIWQRANAETKPVVPTDSPDYFLKLSPRGGRTLSLTLTC